MEQIKIHQTFTKYQKHAQLYEIMIMFGALTKSLKKKYKKNKK